MRTEDENTSTDATMGASRRACQPPPATPNRLMFKFFTRYAARYMGKHFHGVRLSGPTPAIGERDGPVIVYLNHPSWWDPLTCFVLAARLFPTRNHYGPMDALALGKYPILRRLGLFGVEPGTRRGATQFFRTSLAVLAQPDAVLWVTPEGEFRDPRHRPVRLRPGVDHLARRMKGVRIFPLAVEYPFWQERTPEALVRFGDPVDTSEAPRRSPPEWQNILETELERAMDGLAADALRRDPSAFRPVVSGRAGVGGVYDLWRRAAARVRGERFVPEHGLR